MTPRIASSISLGTGRRAPPVVVLLLASLLLATSCSSLSVAAATVNGQKISESEVETELDTLRDDPVFGEALKRDPDTRGQRRREILQELIYQVIAEQEAKRLRVNVTAGQADNLIAQTARSRGITVDKLLENENLSRAQARRLALRGVRRFALIDKVVEQGKVPEAEVRRVYEGQRDRFVEVHLERITVKTQTQATQVLEELDDGEGFASLAEDRSIDDLADKGGDMGFVPLTSLDVQVQDAVSRAVEGGLTDALQGADVFEIYRVVERKTKSFDEVSDEIRRALTQDDRDQRYQVWLAERVRKARVIVNPKYGRFDTQQQQPSVVPTAPELPK
jgi:parvulin-like peptidyl-prolyl isomerase